MPSNVHHIHNRVNPRCAHSDIFPGALLSQTMCMAFPNHHLRAWREFRGKTLVQVADHLHMTHGSLSKIERGKVPYNQKLLEALAELYMCDAADLIVRDPTDPDGSWSIWDAAKPGERAKIVSIAKTILGGEEQDAA